MRMDHVRTRSFWLGGDFGLLQRLREGAWTRCRLYRHLQFIADAHLGSFAQVLLDDDEEAVPALSNIPVERDAVRAASNDPTMTATHQTYRLEAPLLFRIKRNQHNRDAFVALHQLGFESHLVRFKVF